MSTEANNVKQPYDKPALRAIDLVTEEVMGVCKVNAGSPGPMSFGCDSCGGQFGAS